MQKIEYSLLSVPDCFTFFDILIITIIERSKMLIPSNKYYYLAMTVILSMMVGCSTKPNEDVTVEQVDVIIRNGDIYDGSGNPPYKGDVAISGDRIASIGNLSDLSASIEIDATGLAVAPGFINMLSWASVSLIEDGNSQSDIRQGVTLEVMGEGWSMGPYNEEMKKQELAGQGDIKYDISWTTLMEYLDFLEQKGISPNVASFIGAATIRIHVLGYEDRAPTPEELEKMKELVRAEMEAGALGIGSSLIYAPAFYAETEELIELCKIASEYGGTYISHMRSEGNQLLEALEELITISKEANIPAEIYHLKAAGKENWHKMDAVIERVNEVRSEGLKISADMYTYTAGATGLDAAMPPWVQEGGLDSWIGRLKDLSLREQIITEIITPTDDWENWYLAAGSAENILLAGFHQDSLRYLIGKSLAEVANIFGKSPVETAIELVIKDNSRVETVYFVMSEENIKKKIALPWLSFGSDAGSLAPEGKFLSENPHPRAYGNFARLLGKYSRDEQIIPLEEAIRKLTTLPASNLGITERGALKEGYFADITIFDPATIQDHATFTKPHQYSTGVKHVFVNGVQVLKEGEHTGAKPGRVVRLIKMKN